MLDIAVVGIDCRFPDAPNPEAYWDLLLRGGISADGSIADRDAFDSDAFGIPPAEAAEMDPQHRLLLQAAVRAVEDAGVEPDTLAGSATDVYLGMMAGDWAQLALADPERVTARTGTGNGAGLAANRVSYHLGLAGGSLAVDTACSSSATAVHLAARALLAGDCDLALVGSANLALTPVNDRFYRQASLAAPDGRCKPYAAGADGIGRADGVAMVVLRRLADALADRQRVYAVIRATAVNHDGRSNGFTGPNRWAQRDVIATAYRRAGVPPDRVRFVEGHGTGTVLGDLVEAGALGEIHDVPRAAPCLLGSVKGNIGHTEAAAGIAGLIKVALALHHRTLPASPYAADENPRLRLAARGLALARAATSLGEGEVIAGLSSFGLGGTNAHLVLATAPPLEGPVREPLPRTEFAIDRRFAPPAPRPAAPEETPHEETVQQPGEVTERVIAVIARVGGLRPDDIRTDSSIVDDLGYDSLMLITLKSALEAELPGVGPLSVRDLLDAADNVGSLIAILRKRHG